MWFSKIRETYEDSDSEELETPALSLAWALFVRQQDLDKEMYAMRDLIFVKADDACLITESDPLFRPAVAGQKCCLLRHGIDWPDIASRYDGITVDVAKASGNKRSWQSSVNPFGYWDIDSLCLWNSACVTEMTLFKNAGTPWRYF